MSDFFYHSHTDPCRFVAQRKDSGFTKFLFLFCDLQTADEGQYQCVAESEAGKAERTITLKVQSEFWSHTFFSIWHFAYTPRLPLPSLP